MILKGRSIVKGQVNGETLVSKDPISFFGGVDPKTGIVIDKNNSLCGTSIAGKILVLPSGKGSTVGSYIIYELKKNNLAPAGLILGECETILAIGAILAEIPTIDKIDVSKISDNQKIKLDATEGTVEF